MRLALGYISLDAMYEIFNFFFSVGFVLDCRFYINVPSTMHRLDCDLGRLQVLGALSAYDTFNGSMEMWPHCRW